MERRGFVCDVDVLVFTILPVSDDVQFDAAIVPLILCLEGRYGLVALG